jgi:Protein of unknown function (DUF3035)
MKLRNLTVAVAMIGAVGLSGCASVRQELGAGRVKPDEFAIVPKAPLAMPPDFSNLREPEPGAPRPQQLSPSGEAKAALAQSRGVPKPAMSGQQPSTGERALADAAGAENADPKVRKAMMDELREQRAGRSMTERILFWQGSENEDMVIDAVAEARRIERVQKTGESLTGKGVPVIEKSSEQGLIGRIF